MTKYEIDTRDAYQDTSRAAAYFELNHKSWSWARMMMLRECGLVKRRLEALRGNEATKILDVPVGTGILGTVLKESKYSVVGADISTEMMEFAKEQYSSPPLVKLVKADILALPFDNKSFDVSVVLGLMHRLPSEIRIKAIQELSRVTDGYIIASFSFVPLLKKFKEGILSLVWKNYKPAPASAVRAAVMRDIEAAKLTLVSCEPVFPLLSSEYLLILKTQ